MVKAFIVQCFWKGKRNQKNPKNHSPKCTVNLPGKYFSKPGQESQPLVFKKGYLEALNSFNKLFQIMFLGAFCLSLTDSIITEYIQGNIHSLLRKKCSRLKSSFLPPQEIPLLLKDPSI